MRTSLRDAAKSAEARLGARRELANKSAPVLPHLIGRSFICGPAAGKSIAEIEMASDRLISIEKVVRGQKEIIQTGDLRLESDDVVVVVGVRKRVIEAARQFGREVAGSDLSPHFEERTIILTRKDFHGQTIASLRSSLDRGVQRGIYLETIYRLERQLPLLPQTVVELGDIVTLYGSRASLNRAIPLAGREIKKDEKTDFLFLGAGLAIGLILGSLHATTNNMRLSLGVGGGCMLSGLIFGYLRVRWPQTGDMPPAASHLLRDFGLCTFIAAVGLDSGRQLILTLKHSGLHLVVLGFFISVIPLLLTMAFGRFVLRYNNAAILAGSLAGARGANSAFAQILEDSESFVATIPFAITFCVSCVVLSLFGPVIVYVLQR
jgi:putative transport protein